MRAMTVILTFSVLQGCWLVNKGKSQGDAASEFPRSINPSPLGLTGQLHMVESCDALGDWLRERKLAELKHSFEEEVYWYFNHDQPNVGRGSPLPEMTTSTSAPDNSAGSGTTADNSSGTNGQVNGMEEADVFKNDAEHLYIVRNKELRVIKSWPVDSLGQVGKIALKEQPFEMMLRDKQIILFSHVVGETIESPIGRVGRAEPVVDIASSSMPTYNNYRHTLVTVVDISVPSAPKVMLEKELKGYYQTSRRSGAALRLVYHPQIKLPKELPTHLNLWERKPTDESAAHALIDEAMAKSSEALASWKVNQWFTSGDALIANSCKDIYLPSTGAELAAVRLATFNLDSLAVHEISVLARAHELYANHESIYLSNHYYWGASGPFNYTFFHKFSALDDSSLSYAASGGVEGHLINQFAMDEHKNILRVAVTTTNANQKTVNRVQTLQQDGAELHVVGSTADLAENERIFSARFMGDRGYIVTFRQIDPLFTLDLADATNLIVRGELKIPGVSTYLHPVGDHQLVGIGNEAGRLKLSYFDLDDMAHPREVNALQYPSGSEAQYEHRAVVDAAWLGRFAIPTASYYPTKKAALLLFKTDKDNGIKEAGRLDVSDLVGSGYTLNDSATSSAPTSSPMAYRVRGYFMNDVVFALTDKGVRAAKVDEASVAELKTLIWE